ncbi:MAG: hypothetical protein HY696_04050 [Deltaproteobacteria bacterium]|nr:hypothetical protein [Deltaproteobacteria bacterium]
MLLRACHWSLALLVLVIGVGRVSATDVNLRIGRGGQVATRGVAGGHVAVERILRHPALGICSGWFRATPNHTVSIAHHGVYVINVRSTVDVTLVVVGPSESECNDDAHAKTTNPSVMLSAPGRYHLYVGTKDQQPHPYTLAIADGAG